MSAIRTRRINPIPVMAALVTRLSAHTLDKGTTHFDPSTLSFTTVDVGNPATNVIPAEARATLQHPLQRHAHARNRLQRWIADRSQCR